VQEALDNDLLAIPALHESLADVESALDAWTTLVAHAGSRLVAAARGRLDGTVWEIGRVMVVPDRQGRGLGRTMLSRIEAVAPAEAASYSLFTGARSTRNQRMYRRAGYSVRGPQPGLPGAVLLTKRRRTDG
jgi:tRNA (guanine37-N1)-methyltransferase